MKDSVKFLTYTNHPPYEVEIRAAQDQDDDTPISLTVGDGSAYLDVQQARSVIRDLQAAIKEVKE